MYVTVKFTYRDSVSQKKLDVSQKRLRRSTKKRVSQKNYELQRHTKKTARSNEMSLESSSFVRRWVRPISFVRRCELQFLLWDASSDKCLLWDAANCNFFCETPVQINAFCETQVEAKFFCQKRRVRMRDFPVRYFVCETSRFGLSFVRLPGSDFRLWDFPVCVTSFARLPSWYFHLWDFS